MLIPGSIKDILNRACDDSGRCRLKAKVITGQLIMILNRNRRGIIKISCAAIRFPIERLVGTVIELGAHDECAHRRSQRIIVGLGHRFVVPITFYKPAPIMPVLIVHIMEPDIRPADLGGCGANCISGIRQGSRDFPGRGRSQ